MTDNAKKEFALLDTKFGTVDPASISEQTSKTDKPYLTATMVTGSGKEVTIYAHGEKRIAALREKAATGEPLFVTGELLAKGAGISASKFEPTTYSGKITEITKEGENDGRPWAAAKLKVADKEKPMAILATGDDVARVKQAGDAEIAIDAVWVARKREDGSWRSSAVSANTLMREPAPEAGEPEAPGV